MMEKPSKLLEVSHQVRDGGVVVTARGELDMLTTPQLAEELSVACTMVVAPSPVVADLREITFMSSSAIGCLVDTHQKCADTGTPLRIVAEDRVVRRPLDLLGLSKTLHIADRLESALAVSTLDDAEAHAPE